MDKSKLSRKTLIILVAALLCIAFIPQIAVAEFAKNDPTNNAPSELASSEELATLTAEQDPAHAGNAEVHTAISEQIEPTQNETVEKLSSQKESDPIIAPLSDSADAAKLTLKLHWLDIQGKEYSSGIRDTLPVLVRIDKKSEDNNYDNGSIQKLTSDKNSNNKTVETEFDPSNEYRLVVQNVKNYNKTFTINGKECDNDKVELRNLEETGTDCFILKSNKFNDGDVAIDVYFTETSSVFNKLANTTSTISYDIVWDSQLNQPKALPTTIKGTISLDEGESFVSYEDLLDLDTIKNNEQYKEQLDTIYPKNASKDGSFTFESTATDGFRNTSGTWMDSMGDLPYYLLVKKTDSNGNPIYDTKKVTYTLEASELEGYTLAISPLEEMKPETDLSPKPQEDIYAPASISNLTVCSYTGTISYLIPTQLTINKSFKDISFVNMNGQMQGNITVGFKVVGKDSEGNTQIVYPATMIFSPDDTSFEQSYTITNLDPTYSYTVEEVTYGDCGYTEISGPSPSQPVEFKDGKAEVTFSNNSIVTPPSTGIINRYTLDVDEIQNISDGIRLIPLVVKSQA